MRSFQNYIDEKKVKKMSPDLAEADSLIQQAQDRVTDLLSLPLNEKNSSFRFESAYEALRETIQAFMSREGFKPYSHEAIIAYAYENELLNEGEAINLDRYREKRNDINYRGQKITVDEAKMIISFTKDLIAKLVINFKK